MTANKTGIRWKDKSYTRSSGRMFEHYHKYHSTAPYDPDGDDKLEEANRLQQHLLRLEHNIAKNTRKGRLSTVDKLRGQFEIKYNRLLELGQRYYG